MYRYICDKLRTASVSNLLGQYFPFLHNTIKKAGFCYINILAVEESSFNVLSMIYGQGQARERNINHFGSQFCVKFPKFKFGTIPICDSVAFQFCPK
jgi:hypothetical protein